jgi:DNA-binding transcriptional MocR family regulator
MDPWSTVEALPPGNANLRRQIARRYVRSDCKVAPDEIVITAGALEALNLALQVCTQPGDTVAVESPTFYGCLQAIEALGLKALEIPTDPREGVELSALAQQLEKQSIQACWFMTTFQNPLGATMSPAKKADLVNLLTEHQVPLIEDDVYAELYFGTERPQPAKAFDKSGLVLHCGSFSKSLAPGYRLGWVAAGQFAERVQRRKTMTSLATSMPIQAAIAAVLGEDGYDAHLRKLRRHLEQQQAAALRSLETHLPTGCRITRPQGGYFLWVELPQGVDTIEMHTRALEQGVSMAPGPIFSARKGFAHCLRLNTGHPWTAEMDRGVAILGQIAGKLLR